MIRRRKVLFLQLPQLDNDTASPSENLMMAAAYLEHAVRRSGEGRHHAFSRLDPALDRASTRALSEAVLRCQPDVIAATLYLWNIEWTLRLLRLVRAQAPATRIVVGGPEVARRHPFLFRSGIPDVAVTGEGENVFPAILRALREGGTADFTTVATRRDGRYSWGRLPPPPVELAEALPPLESKACGPDRNGMAYLETSRGCPMRCAYCRYAHLRPRVSFLPPERVATRVAELRRRGAREIRFVDPTFNAHPRFAGLLRELADLNRDRRLRFFAEVMAERLTPEGVRLLAAANFTEVEVGMQSRDPAVLKEIRRPTRLSDLDRGVRLLSASGIRVTLDIMYALPRQTPADIRRCLAWSLRQPRLNIQCLQTLLLPGTGLRDRRNQWGLAAQRLPPYAVTGTPHLSGHELGRIEARLARHPRLRSDTPSRGFVARRFPDLFEECVTLDAACLPAGPAGGTENRRTYRIRGADLFGRRRDIARFVSRCIRAEPDSLFQFVLEPESEEPLDLLDCLIGVIRQSPPHLVDRYGCVQAGGRIASRRIRILLPRGRKFAAGWMAAAGELLSGAFF